MKPNYMKNIENNQQKPKTDLLNTELENLLIKVHKNVASDVDKLYHETRTVQTIESARHILQNYNQILSTIQKQAEKIHNIIENCKKFTYELENDIDTPRSEEYVYQTKSFMLNYKSTDEISQIKEISQKINELPVRVEPLGYLMTLPIIKSLKDLHHQHSIYYCEETKSVWMVLPGSNLMKIPFPDIIDSVKTNEKINSIRCRYQTKALCSNSKHWSCSYAHSGEKMIKLGYPIRCPSVPNFGNPATIREDIRNIKMTDIKSLLMYGLNDVMIAAIWLNYNNKKDQCYDSIDRG